MKLLRSTGFRISLNTWCSKAHDPEAEDIAREVDSIGGNMDAFTGKEMVCFNVKILDEHVPVAMDVLSDMVLNPVFDAKEIRAKRA